MLRRMRGSLICGNSGAAAAAGFMLALTIPAGGQSCAPTGEIVSNNMQYCAGSGDTLWIASSRQGWGLNYTTNRGAAWGGYSLGCYPEAYMSCLVFGAGRAVAVLNPPSDAFGRTGPTTVWSFRHADAQASSFTLDWPAQIRNDTMVSVQARSAVFVAGNVYFACGHGGLVRWDPSADSVRGFLFGDTVSFDPSSFSRTGHPGFGTDTTALLSVGLYTDTAVLAVTAPRLLLFDPVLQAWDTTIGRAFADTSLHGEAFVDAFVNNTAVPPLLYACVDYDTAGSTCSALFRYSSPQRQWHRVLGGTPAAAAPAARGCLYALNGDNEVVVYRDTVPDTGAAVPGELQLVQNQPDFDARLLMGLAINKPRFINDLVFLGTGDSTGSLCVATSEGLFVSWEETAGDSGVGGEFTLVRRDRVIQNGLAETYALPGIITDDPRWSPKTFFVYKLTRDADVTIRIYDYNMHYVRSVVENAPRKAVTPFGRSTDSRYDVWDGTAASGRPVAPGVYYYKITTSRGERSFGKVVVAKGRGR
jgi:hypothetical protein